MENDQRLMEYDKIAPIMGNLWSPIAAVTSRWQDRSNVQICVAIGAASIVPDKPRVLVQIYKTNHSHGMILSSGAFALNFPRPDQLQWIKDFGLVSGRDRDKLAGVESEAGESGSPLILDCWGYLDCRVINAMDGGDMTCFLADVLDGATRTRSEPLRSEPLWWRDARSLMPQEWLKQWELKQTGEVAHSRTRMATINYTPWQQPS